MNDNDKASIKQDDSEGKDFAKEGNHSADKPAENDSSLQALVQEEQSYVRDRLRKEIGREPSQEEVDRWLSEQTEGY